MSLATVMAENRRGSLLRVLHDQGSFSLNDSVLRDALEAIGDNVSRDTVRVELAWLRDQGLVRVDELKGSALWLAVLTERGEDVACGRAVVPGVKRPSPRP